MKAERPAPSAFFTAQLEALRRTGSLGPALDLACGRGRHALAAGAAGVPTLGLDRSQPFLAELRAEALERNLPVQAARTDLEAGWGIPVASGSCGAILVFRFLHRPLASAIVEALRPGGLLLYETFTSNQTKLSYGPRNPAFLLRPGELKDLFPALEIGHYEEGVFGTERPEALARLAARKAR